MTYLDSAATSQIDPEVIETMIEYMKTQYGNPVSKYYPQAVDAQNTLNASRAQVASLLNTESQFVLFTAGASESNNFIIKGVADKLSHKGKHIITSSIEHKSVLETCKYLETKGFEVTYLPVTPDGIVNPEILKSSIRPDTILVSIMWANNEIGTINDIEKLTTVCHEYDVYFHSDATQAIGKVEIDLNKIPVDFLSMSAHKIYGPKGIGAAYIGPDDLGIRIKLTPLIHGGSQEYRMRGGTHAMHDIVGFGRACEIAKRDMHDYIPKIIEIENELKQSLLKKRPDITFNGNQTKKIPGLLSINIPGINNELFCKQVSESIAISTGSACSISESSYVLEALSKSSDSTLRLSLSKFNNTRDVREILIDLFV
jgi:cysteine desulfurase